MADNTYSRGKIYMIESASAGLVYYGSTCNDLYKRMGMHRTMLKRFQTVENAKSYTSFGVLAHPDARIILVEPFPCANKQELTAREAYYIRNNECVNKVIPGRSKAERYQENKEEILEWQKLYWQDNKANILEKKKRPKHCETCNCSVRHDAFLKHTKSKKTVVKMPKRS